MGRRVGIDVSRWQAVVPWATLPAAGISFGYVKATHGLGVDPSFARNWAASRGVLPRGAYHWLTDQPAELQAEHVVRTLEGTGDLGELHIAVDFEEPSTQYRGLPLLIHLLQCLRRVRELTGGVVMYSGKWYWDQFVALDDGPAVEELVEIPYWHAEYPRAEVADRRACGLAPPTLSAPHLPRAWSKRGIAEAIWQFDGDGGCMLPNGVDADFDLATDEGLRSVTRSGHRDTDPAPSLELVTAPQTPEALRIVPGGASAVTSLRADEGQHEIE